ncbi:MAG: hypothetical protein V1721_08275 [Pseudomonadota bacterium]
MVADVIESIKFPVICLQDKFLRIRLDMDSLITTTKAGLKNNYFSNLLIVDSNLCAFRIKSAKKLYGVGPFWGYNIFLNQKIKVELQFEGTPKKIPLNEIKQRILGCLEKGPAWSSVDNLNEIKSKIEHAVSYDEIIELLKHI